MSATPELGQLSLEELQRTFVNRNGKDASEEAESWLQEAAIRMADTGDEGIQFLLSRIPGADEDLMRAILLGLSSTNTMRPDTRRNEICTLGQSLLNDARALVRMDALDLLRCHGCTDAREKVLEHLSDPSPHVVGGCLRYLARLFPTDAIPLLEEMLTSEESIVRQNAIDELDELNCVQALPAIKRLLQDQDRYVRQAARTTVSNLES